MTAYDYENREWCQGEQGARVALKNAIKNLEAAEQMNTWPSVDVDPIPACEGIVEGFENRGVVIPTPGGTLAAFIDDQLAVIAEANAEIARYGGRFRRRPIADLPERLSR